jgi:mRNA-degrading endonuclease HigB of HigAB toxin-antitoxin module
MLKLISRFLPLAVRRALTGPSLHPFPSRPPIAVAPGSGWVSRLLAAVLLLAGGTAAFGQATIRGRATFRDAAGGISPIRNSVVELNDHNWISATVWGPRLIAWTITDQDGNFSMDYDPHAGEGYPNWGNVDPMVFVHFNEPGGTPGRVVTDSAESYGLGFPYGGRWLTGWMYDLPDGVHDLGTLTVDRGTEGAFDDPVEKYWQVRDWIQRDRDRLGELGFPLPSLFNFGMYAPTAATASTAGTLLRYDRRPHNGSTSSGVYTSFSLNDASRDVVSRHMGMQELFFLFDARHDPAVFPAYPNEAAATLPVRQVTPQVALVEGFGLFVTALMKGEPLVNNGSSTNPYLFNIELNHDGWGTSNGNSDRSSDLPGRSGNLTAAAVAAMLWDLIDASDIASDPYDRSTISLQDLIGVLDTYKPDGYRPPHSAAEFLEGYYAQNRGLLPMVAGAAQIHGMTLDRFTRPTIGVTALSTGPGPFYWNGPISGSMTVRNFGSQNYESLGSGSWHLRLDSPSGAIFPGNAMLVRTTGIEDLPAGWSRTVAASVPAIWPGVKEAGTYNLRGMYVTNDGVSRMLQVAGDDMVNPLPVMLDSDTSAPLLTVLDDGTYQASRTSMRVRATASDLESGIVRYDIAVGTAPGLTDVKDWQTFNTGATSLEQVITGFSVFPGTELFATVRAANGEYLTRTASTNGIVVDDGTQNPWLYTPLTGSYIRSPMNIYFFLPESALAGSVTLGFSGPATSSVTLTAASATAGYHFVTLDKANLGGSPLVAGVTGSNALPDGVYTVSVSYRDAAGNPPASDSSFNVTLDSVAPVINGVFTPLTLDAGSPLPDYAAQAVVTDVGSGVESLLQYPPATTPALIGWQRVTLTATDQAGNFTTRDIWVSGNPLGTNHAPTDLDLSFAYFPENTEPNFVVGTLTATDADVGDIASFSLVAGAGDDHNGLFNINGNELRLTSPLDFETGLPLYSIRVRATDSGGEIWEEVLTLTLTNQNETPSFTAGPNLAHAAGEPGPRWAAGWAMNLDDGDATVAQSLYFQLTATDPHGVLAFGPEIDGTSGDLTYELTGLPGTVTVSAVLVDDNMIGGIPRASDPQVFTITVGAKIEVRGNEVVIENGDLTPSPADDTDFGDVAVRDGFMVRTFTIRNRGESPLDITDVNVAADHAGFMVTVGPAPVVPPDETTTFQIAFDPTLPGVVNGLVTIVNADPDTGSYTFAITGTGSGPGTAPEIEVSGNDVAITDGDTTPEAPDQTDFGGTMLHAGYVPHTFAIYNSGDADLVLGPVTITGPAAADFAVLSPPDSPLPPGVGTTWVIAFTPRAEGMRQATVSFTNSDADESPFDFAVQGIGYPDGTTLPPFLYSPAEDGATASPVFVHFYLSENMLPGSVKLSFTGPVATTLTLDPSLATEGSRSLDLNAGDLAGSPLVTAVVGSNTLPDGLYTVTLTCQDAAGNPAASDTRARVMVDTVPPVIGGAFTPLRFAAGSALPDYAGQAVVSDVGSGLSSVVQDPPEGAATAVGMIPITLTATDRAGNQTSHTFSVEAIDAGSNSPPSAIHLSDSQFPENTAPNHVVGTLSADDVDPGDTATFALVTGSGAADNALFNIHGNELRLSNPVDFEISSGFYSVRVRVTDSALAHSDVILTLAVTNVNEMPSFLAGPNQHRPAGSTGEQQVPGWAQSIDTGDGAGTQALEFSTIIEDPDGVLSLPPVIDATTGDLSYQLSGAEGTATIHVFLTDDPSIDGISLTTAAQTFTITVGAPAVPPALTIRQEEDPVEGRVIVVSWPAGGGGPGAPVLESAPEPGGPWVAVDPGTITLAGAFHEYRVPLAGAPASGFFRLAY